MVTEGSDDDDTSMDVSASSAASNVASPEGSASKKSKPKHCVVCRKKWDRADLTYHRFPKKRKAEWMTACGLTEYKDSYRVCSLHFAAADWAKKGGLKPEAVPSREMGVGHDVGAVGETSAQSRHCVVCRKRSNNPAFRIPKEGRQRWLQACGLEEYKDWHRVCGLHFSPEDFDSDGTLKSGVLPTLSMGAAQDVGEAGETRAQSRHCVVCRKRSNKPAHRIPKKGRQQWMQACRLDEYKDSHRVCGLHFAPEDFDSDGTLKADVLPTKNMGGGAEGDQHDQVCDEPFAAPGVGAEEEQQHHAGAAAADDTSAYCVVCRKRSTGPGRKHHRFPKDRRVQWMEACHLGHFKVRYRICSLHFGPDDYDRNGKLKPNAVPSRNMPGMLYVVPEEVLDEIAGGEAQQPGAGGGLAGGEGGEEEADAREENDLEQIAEDIDQACNATAVTEGTRRELAGLKQKIARLRVKP